MTSLVGADWIPLGTNVFFRKVELYSMEWSAEVDLSQCIVAAASFAGPVAIIRDDRKASRSQSSGRPIISIYSSAGRRIAQLKWTSGRIVHMAWSNTEELLCIQEDGTVLIHDLFGNFKPFFSMGQEVKETQVLDCKVFNSFQGTGVAVMTSSHRIFVVNNVNDPRPRRMADIPGMDTPPSAWIMINHDRQTRALVARDAQLFLLDIGGQCQEQRPKIHAPFGAFTEMAVSFNNKHLALFTDTGILWLGSSDLQNVYCEFDTQCKQRPTQLVWCGTGAVVGYWQNVLLMVGPHKDWSNETVDGPVHLVAEPDGLRIISTDKHELLQKVPECVQEVLGICSMSPGAILVEASKNLVMGSHKADEYLRSIRGQLDIAVGQCVEAAGHEYLPNMQKLLLRAASFGKSFLSEYNSDNFVRMCRMLRVLNAVRDFATTGLPLTCSQLELLSVEVLLDRLVIRRQYCLAIRISQYLKIAEQEGASRILAHWACFKVEQTEVDDDTVARAIAGTLGDTPGISYSEIAHKAAECGRTELAIRLLEHEPRAGQQVPLLMKMKRDALALSKAVESGDTDLVYTVILQLKESLPKDEFFMAIRNMPVAFSLYLQLCRQQENLDMLKALHYQEDNFIEEANCCIAESYQETQIQHRINSLQAAKSSFQKAKNDFAVKQTEEQIRLMRNQLKLEEKFGTSFLDKSVQETLFSLILDNQYKLADEFRKEYKIPDRRFWFCKVNAMAEAGEWLELDKFSKSKKSPIGYEPFVDTCLRYNNKFEAQKYLARILPENKVKYCVKAGQLEQAADAAFQQKNVEYLDFVLSKCGVTHRKTSEKIATYKAQLG